ncbi:unnamed protein product, partial [Rotaria sp. Silwood2]
MAVEITAGAVIKLSQQRQAQWYWKSNPTRRLKNEKEEWIQFSDIESEIIEEALNGNHNIKLIELDDYWIDLNHSIQI